MHSLPHLSLHNIYYITICIVNVDCKWLFSLYLCGKSVLEKMNWNKKSPVNILYRASNL